MLTGNPGVRMLATSREALESPGERVCPVDPLQSPRRRRRRGHRSLRRRRLAVGAPSVGRLDWAAESRRLRCHRQDLPHAGGHSARSRTRRGTVPYDVAAEAGRGAAGSFEELAPPRYGAIPRHRTIAAVVDWGFELLSPLAQAALRAMSVFAGGCDFAAFRAAWASARVDQPRRGVLEELVRTSFVSFDRADQRSRYRLLEPVRQFAAALLEASAPPTSNAIVVTSATTSGWQEA